MRRVLSVLGLLAAMALPGVARADDNPHLISRVPSNGAVVRQQNAPDFTATYDRDIMGPPLSSIQIVDKRNVAVQGDLRLSGPDSPTGGKRAITFTPSAPFSEALSPYNVRIVVEAASDPTATARDESHFEIDNTAPFVPTILTPRDGSAVKPHIEIHGTTSPGAAVRVIGTDRFFPSTQADGDGAWKVDVTLPEGVHTFWATATDGAGNESAGSSAVSIAVDPTAPPAPAITSPAAGETVRSSPFTLRGTAEPANTITVVEGTAVLPCIASDGCSLVAITSSDHTSGAWQASATLPDGPHVLKFIATDAAGNIGPASSVGFTMDASMGAPLISSPSENALIGSAAVVVTGTSLPGWTVQIREAGVLLASAAVGTGGSWTATLTLADGQHTLVVQAVNGTEMTGTRTRRIRIDTTGPDAPVFTSPEPGGVTTAEDAQISGTAEVNSIVRVYEGQTLLGTTVASALRAWGIEAQLASGAHTITANATDRAGNTGISAAVSFTADDVKPVIQITTLDPYASILEPFRIEGRAQDNDRVVRVVVTYRDARHVLVLTEYAILTPVGGPDIAWRADGSGLRAGVYFVEVEAVDRAGNDSDSKTMTAIRVT